MKVLAVAGASAVLCSLLAGCSISAAPPGTAAPAESAPAAAAAAAAPPVRACDLALEADAATALGADPGPGLETEGEHGSSSCSYGQYPSLLVVNLLPGDGKAAYANQSSQSAAGVMTPVDGIGDQAFSLTTSGTVGLDFTQGDTFVSILLATGTDPHLAEATALAATLAGRL